MKSILLIVGLIIFTYLYVVKLESDTENARIHNEQRRLDLQDMSIPPTLSSTMKDPSWTIKYWISADKIHSDCKTAHEFMDKGVSVRRYKGRRGRAREYHISNYLSSCEKAAEMALELVEAPAKKWCHYRDTDARLETLCKEWTTNGDAYINNIKRNSQETLKRYNRVKSTLRK